jgi:hypothetical protein
LKAFQLLGQGAGVTDPGRIRSSPVWSRASTLKSKASFGTGFGNVTAISRIGRGRAMKRAYDRPCKRFKLPTEDQL